jgi:6-phosphogluconolactonase (cycloisomerase 2 family)
MSDTNPIEEDLPMRTIAKKAVAAFIVTLAAAALSASPANAADPRVHDHGVGHVVFVQTDDVTGNHVVAYHRHADGTLTFAHSYATNGLGGILTGSVVDHLASQGSLTYDSQHALLYAVNAGSNTVSVFAVNGDRLRLRQVAGSGGTFPVSVAVHENAVYVLNARDGGSVQGFITLDGHLFPIRGWHRDLGLDPTQTPEFTHTPGQVAVSPSGQWLVVTTKGNGSAIDVFALNRFGSPSAVPTVNPEPGAVPFAVTFDARGILAVAEAGTNAVETFRIGTSGALTSLSSLGTAQAATCWIVRDGSLLFLSNAGSANLTGLRTTAAGALSLLGNSPTDAGTVDAAISSGGGFLYVQAGATGSVNAFAVHADGSLAALGSVLVPNAAGGEGIVAI